MKTSLKTISPYVLRKKKVKPMVYLIHALFTAVPALLILLLPITRSIPLDRILLPTLFAPLLGLLLYKPSVGYVSAISGALFVAFFGHNLPATTGFLLCFETVLFVALAHQLHKNPILRWVCAPLSITFVKLITFFVLLVVPALTPDYFTAKGFLIDSMSNGVLGFTLLMGVNVLTLKHLERVNYYYRSV